MNEISHRALSNKRPDLTTEATSLRKSVWDDLKILRSSVTGKFSSRGDALKKGGWSDSEKKGQKASKKK